MGNIEDRATIPFERPLKEKEVGNLMKFIAEHINGCRLSYSIQRQVRLSTDAETSELSSENYISGISASITSFIEKANELGELRMGNFEGIKEPLTEEHRRYLGTFIYGLRFFVAPGYDESEVPETELALMDEVRQKTQEFFEEQ